MILPDKYVNVDKSLLGQAAQLLASRRVDQTVTELWSTMHGLEDSWSFDRFSLALSLLHSLGVVNLENGILVWSAE